MKFTFYQRLLFISIAPMLVITLLLGAYFSTEAIKSMESQWHQRGEDIVRHMAPSSEYGVISGNQAILQSLVQSTADMPDIRGVAIIDPEGKVIAVSGKVLFAPPKSDKPVSLVSDTSLLSSFSAPIHRTTVAPDNLFELASVETKSSLSPEVIGQVIITMDRAPLIAQQREVYWHGAGILGLALVFFGFLVLRFTQNIINPINRLVEAAQLLSEGRFSTRVSQSSEDEIGQLERGFNHMAEQLSESHRTMQERINEATAQLAYQALHDPLTGLINRREFESRLEATIRMAHGGEKACVLFIDLDRFKKVNDSAGHLAGDELLRRISRQLQSRLRDTDTLARLGGDEFAVLLPNSTGENASNVANSLCSLVSQFQFLWKGKVFTIGASIGLVELDTETSSLTDVMAAGDSACYAAKAAGRNRVEIFEKAIQHEQRQNDVTPLKTRLENALENHLLEFKVRENRPSHAHQPPCLDLDILIRDDQNTSPIPLSLMMEAVERCEMAHFFDQQSIAKALQLIQQSPQRIVLISLSNAVLHDPEAYAHLEESIRQLGERSWQLGLLLNEVTASENPSEALRLRDMLKQTGAQFGLDHFGGLIRNFEHIEMLQPEFIRLTPSLTREISQHRNAVSLVRAIQEIAEDHQIKTLAKDVDRIEDFQILEQLGINYLQGESVVLMRQ